MKKLFFCLCLIPFVVRPVSAGVSNAVASVGVAAVAFGLTYLQQKDDENRKNADKQERKVLYYCPSKKEYFPFVDECKEGWKEVEESGWVCPSEEIGKKLWTKH